MQPGPSDPTPAAKFVVAVPVRTTYYNAYARTLSGAGLLKAYALGTRRGTEGVPPEQTSLNPLIGLAAFVGTRLLSEFGAESFRFRLLPWFDRWVLKQLRPGDHVLSSYGYANACFRFARRNGGKTFVEAGNSHIEQFWEILTEEQRRWNSPYLPVARHWYERSRAMLAEGADFVLSPSSYVSQSFLSRGFKPEQILKNVFPVDLTVFQPPTEPRPRERPLTVINTGSLSLRKGTPYLLESFRLVHRQSPSARLLLTRHVRNDIEPILSRYRDLPIEWSEGLSHAQLVERLRSADVFVLPSLEEGLVRTALEAMACGLQVVLTPNTGANDFVRPGINGEIVPIRDPQATAEAILKCWERAKSGPQPVSADLRQQLSLETFAREFLAQLRKLGLAPA